MKTLVLSLFCLAVSSVSLACTRADSTSSPRFCETFTAVAQCHCSTSGLPQIMCSDVKLLHQRMLDTFGSLEATCAFQHDTSKEDCIEAWTCYMQGGVDMQGNPCNSTGQPC